MPGTLKRDGGIKAAQLLIAAGVFTLINNVLPGNEHLDLAVLYLTGGIAVAIGVGSLFVPWERLPQPASLALAVVALSLVSVSDAYGGVSDFSYAVYFIVIFVWVGLAQPPYTSLVLAPVATLAYLAPDLWHHATPELASSATVAIPVCVLVGEVVARATGRHRRASDGLQERVRVVERLATLTARIGSDPDPVGVSQALVDCAASIFEGKALFASVSGSQLIPMACRGLDDSILTCKIPIAATSVERAAASPRLIAICGPEGTTLPLPAGGCAVTVACRSDDDIIGALTVVLERSPGEVSDEVQDVLRLIGAQGEVALRNAARHSALMDEHRHEQAIFDVLLDGVIVLDTRGRVQSCNDAAADVFGWSVESMLGRPLPIAIEDGESIETEISAGRWIESCAARLEGGETVIALRDVSRQHALDEAKDLFLATTSHELRTPLTAIKGYVSTLQRHWSRLSDADRRRALSVVDEQVDSLIRLTDHLLLSARAAANPSPQVTFDVGLVARRAASAYAEVSDEHLISAEVTPALPLAYGDPDSVRSILAQLIENAVKYSPGGGEVKIEVGLDGERIVVDVLDRGVGIPAGRAETLFAPFMQGQAVNTRSFGGVGLGLYIVRRLVVAQGGEITAFSREGGGSGFRFWLPTRSSLPAPRQSAEMAAGA